VLVRVHASSVNIAEWYAMTGLFIGRLGQGLLKPKDPRLGADFAGVVEAVGSSVTDFKPGDKVFGGRTGAFAEYVCVKKALARKPANLTFEQAAAVPTAAITALQGLRDYGQIQPGQKVLINGATGGVGTFAVQIAKAFGAEVTGVTSARNADLVRAIGADHVVDYTAEDFTRNGRRYDLVLQICGDRSLRDLRRALTPRGTLVLVGGGTGRHEKGDGMLGPLAAMIKGRFLSRFTHQRIRMFITKGRHDDLVYLSEQVEAGSLTPVIDRSYPLADAAEAIRYLEAGHARGKVVVTM
jgi:NADPH:quinone reductase-like Zn-dependent oxidoreductase